MHVTAIVLAAGQGKRLKSKVIKPLIRIKGKSIILYSLEAFHKHPFVKDIVVVVNSQIQKKIKNVVKENHLAKVKKVVLGGALRQDSVYRGLQAVNAYSDLVLIHDAARPFVDSKIISAVIKEAKRTKAAIVGVRVKNTIKEGVKVSGCQSVRVKRTIDRSRLWEIQTPQVFEKGLLLKAFAKNGKREVTDDAMLVERLGVEVSIVEGRYDNIKITTPEDLIIAAAIAKG